MKKSLSKVLEARDLATAKRANLAKDPMVPDEPISSMSPPEAIPPDAIRASDIIPESSRQSAKFGDRLKHSEDRWG